MKKLTQNHCVHIAKMAVPNVDWRYYENKPENKWSGYDCVGIERNGDGFEKDVFQITFDGKCTYFYELWECELSAEVREKIKEYIKTL